MQQRTKRMVIAAATAAVSTASFWTFKADAATFTWSGGGANDSIGTAANWIGSVAPGTAGADDWVFTGSTRTSPLNDYGPPRFALGTTSVFNIFFDANAQAFTLGGSTITMGNANPAGGNITNNSAFTQTFSTGVAPRTGTIAANTADIVFNGSFSAGNTPNLQTNRGSTIAGTHNVFFNAGIFNGGFLLINGTGTTFLKTDNTAANPNTTTTWNGTVTINTGNLQISNSNALGDTAATHGTTVAGGTNTGALQFDGSAGNLTVSEPITVAGRTVTNAELTNIAGNNALNNVATAAGGSTFNFNSNAGKLTIGTLNAVGQTGDRFWNLQGAGDGEIDGVNLASASTTLRLIKTGTGSWTIGSTVTATFSGQVTASGGNLVIGNGIGPNFTGAASITTGGTLVVTSQANNDVGELGNINVAGPIAIASGGTLDASSFTVYSLQPGQQLTNGGTFKVGGELDRFGDNNVIVGTDGGAGTFNLIGNLSLNNQFAIAGRGLKFDLSNVRTPGSGINDIMSISGNLIVSSANGQIPVIVNQLNGALSTGSYELMSYGGSLTGSASDFTIVGASSGTTRQAFSIDTSINHEVDLVVSGSAANLVWKGDSAGNAWDVVQTADWKNGVADDFFYNFDIVNFNDTTANTTVNLNTTAIPGQINVNTAQSYVVTGSGTITGGATLIKSGSGTFILANAGTNDFSGAITINAGTLQIGNGGTDGSIGPGSISNSGALVVNKTASTTLPNLISGTGALVVKGTGGLVLNTNNTYSGPTIVNAGRLTVGSANALGDPTGGTTVTATGAEVAVFSPLTINEPITLNGSGFDSAGGALHAGGSTTVVWNGPITLGSDTTIKVDGNAAALLLGNTITGNNTNLTLGADTGGTGTASFPISLGTGALIKTGGGTWALTATNSYTGGTRIDAGVLAPASLAAISSGSINLNGGTFRYPAAETTDLSPRIVLAGGGGGIDTNGNSITFSSAIGVGATGGLTKTGGGTLTLAAANSYSGPTNINNGVLQATDGVGIPVASNLTFSGGTLETTANISRAVGTGAGQIQVTGGSGGITATGADVAVTITNGGSPISWGSALFNPNTINFNKAGSSNTLTFNGDLSMDTTGTINANGGTVVMNTAFSSTGGLNINGSGLLVLTRSSTFTGGVTLNPGTQGAATARLAANNALGTGNILISPGGNATLARLELIGGVTESNPISFNGRNNNSVGIENISGNNTLSGTISMNAGGGTYWIQSDAGLLTLSGADPAAAGVALQAGSGGRVATLQGAGNGVVSGIIQNGGAASVGVTKAGTGMWQLTGANTYTGLTTVKNGTLELGTAAQNPVLSTSITPGAADVQGGRLVFDYSGATIAPTIKSLLATSFNSTGSFTNNTNRIYSSTSTGTLGLGMTDDATSKVTVGYTVFGDANLDGKVNALDFNAIATNYGSGVYWYQGDFNYDGAVDTSDFTKLSQNFGLIAPTPTATQDLPAPVLGSLVPEPGMMGLIFAGATMTMSRRRRHARLH